MGIQLPKKSFHSISDLCKEWGIDYSTFDHYVDDRKILRLALKTNELHKSTYKCLRVTEKLKKHIDFLIDSRIIITAVVSDIERLFIKTPETQGDDFIARSDLSIYSGGTTYTDRERKEKRLTLDEILDSFEITTGKKYIVEDKDFFELPNWMFINGYHMIQEEETPQVTGPRTKCLLLFENFHGEKYLLLFKEPIDLNKYNEIFCAYVNSDVMDSVMSSFSLIIPEEEKQRFEAECFQQNVPQEDESGDKGLSPKSKNAYLRTIRALSEALAGGLTGKSSTDAQIILAALKRAEVTAPIGERALINYLEQAKDL